MPVLPSPQGSETIPEQSTALSAYRIMWIFVFFDLPVGTKKERKAATKFRLSLLDLGFEISQFSVYLKFCAGKEQGDALSRQVKSEMPPSGKVHLVYITDKHRTKTYAHTGDENGNPAQKCQSTGLF